ncbi:MAG: FmdB family zinc ribbon protein [Exilispira sp.]
MPTYEFFCNNCNNNFEKWLSMKEEHKVTCPGCGSDNVKKIFNTVSGILFKGKGFYCTDYKNKKEESCCSSSSNKDNLK